MKCVCLCRITYLSHPLPPENPVSSLSLTADHGRRMTVTGFSHLPGQRSGGTWGYTRRQNTLLGPKRSSCTGKPRYACFPEWVLAPAVGSSDSQGCVKGTWSSIIQKASWARPMISRIILQQELGREPTSFEVEDQIIKFKLESIPRPSLDAIAEIFGEGEMVCLLHFAHIQATN